MNIDELGAHPEDVATLEAAARAVDGGLVIVTGSDVTLSAVVVERAAQRDVASTALHRGAADAAALDVHLVAPTAARWSVADVEERVIAPAKLRPVTRAHIVIADGHTLAAASDRLLKAVEEPRNDVLFWLCVPTLTAASATLRSRAARTLNVRPAPAGVTAAAMVAYGLTQQQAHRVHELAQPNQRLALCVARNGMLEDLEVAARIAEPPIEVAPALIADAALASTCRLAAALDAKRKRTAAPADARTEWGKLTPQGRAQTRALLQHWVQRAAHNGLQGLPDACTATSVRRIEQHLAACDQARADLDLNIHPLSVLNALMYATRTHRVPTL